MSTQESIWMRTKVGGTPKASTACPEYSSVFRSQTKPLMTTDLFYKWWLSITLPLQPPPPRCIHFVARYGTQLKSWPQQRARRSERKSWWPVCSHRHWVIPHAEKLKQSIVAISPKKNLTGANSLRKVFWSVSFTLYYYLTRTHTQTKVFYLILVWTETSLLLLSKVYLKRNPFNYRAQIAAFRSIYRNVHAWKSSNCHRQAQTNRSKALCVCVFEAAWKRT